MEQGKTLDDSVAEMLFKIVILGEPAVGKSCILNKFVKNEFREDYSVTIGVEFSSKKIEIDTNVRLTLQIWDTAGQESFRSIVKSFYRNAAGAFLVYDITNHDSFKKLDEWVKEMKENAKQSLILILVGNKSDKEGERQVSKEDGLAYMKRNGISLFFETSAKTGENIELAFLQIGKLIFVNYMGQQMLRKDEEKEGERFLLGDETLEKRRSTGSNSCC